MSRKKKKSKRKSKQQRVLEQQRRRGELRYRREKKQEAKNQTARNLITVVAIPSLLIFGAVLWKTAPPPTMSGFSYLFTQEGAGYYMVIIGSVWLVALVFPNFNFSMRI
jgi:hypothetical protein